MTTVVLDVHADDGVWSVGEWIASRRDLDVVVVTMLAAVPRGDEVWVKQLLADKDQACASLGAWVVNLPFLDGKYGQALNTVALAKTIRRTLAELRPTEVLVPLGVGHADHGLTAPVALAEARAYGKRVVVYEDLPYRVMYPEDAVTRAKALDVAEFAGGGGHLAEKRKAVAMFSNQFGEDADRCCSAPERLWVVQ